MKKRSIKGFPTKKGFHCHHKIPIHAGGTDEESNLEYLTIDEHIEAHMKRYRELGDRADLSSACLLQASKKAESFSEVKKELYRLMSVRGAQSAHAVKSSSGFYKKLGKMNAERLAGITQPQYFKMRAALDDAKWFTNGKISVRTQECPEGWFSGRSFKHSEKSREQVGAATRGTRWWTDGSRNLRTITCPGNGWKLGRKFLKEQ